MKLSRSYGFFAVGALAVLLVTVSCGPGDAAGDAAAAGEQYEELTFEVNEELLREESSIGSLGVSYRVPEGWVELDDEQLELFGAQVYPLLHGDNGESLLRLHLDPTSGALYVLSSLDVVAEETAEAALERHEASGYDPEYTVFRKDDFVVRQILFQAGNTVVFRLFFAADGLEHDFEASFLIPRGNYEAIARVIESAIGAIQVG